MASAGGEAKGQEGWQTAAPVQDPKAKLWTPIARLQQGPWQAPRRKGQTLSRKNLARTALGKARMEAFPAPSLFPFCTMALHTLKDLGDPFISLALRKEGAEP